MISPEDLPIPESLSTLLALRHHPIRGRHWMSGRAELNVNRTTHAPIVADLLIIMLHPEQWQSVKSGSES